MAMLWWLPCQFPELSGFQVTNHSHKFQLASNNSIQIHHTDAFYWAVSTSTHTNIRRVATIPVNCTSKMPESLDNMVECETCFQWSHYRCVGIANDRDTALWNCQECRGRCKRWRLIWRNCCVHIIICALSLLKHYLLTVYMCYCVICVLTSLKH